MASNIASIADDVSIVSVSSRTSVSSQFPMGEEALPRSSKLKSKSTADIYKDLKRALEHCNRSRVKKKNSC